MQYIKTFLIFIFLIISKIVIAQDVEELLSARVLGIENAPIIIEEYASMSCGHCASFHIQTLPEIKKKYIDTGRAKLLFRDFPLDRTAMLGSMVTQCMNEKQFFPVLNRLFQKQPEWTQSEDILESIFKTLQPLGIEKPMLLSCLEDNETNKNRWKLLLAGRDYAAKQKGVDATPTFFVNGKKVEGRFDIKKLNSLIE
tara:strand:+ start:1564 stop:2157 length:594 start_codon:yes stop_codon:yes gene_type:complete